MNTICRTKLPKKCWIYANKRYKPFGMSLSELPCVDLKYEFILKANGISYRKTLRRLSVFSNALTEVYEYWNPEVYQEVALTFPLFASTPNGFLYCERNYTEMIPSEETLTAAKDIEKFVETQIKNYEQSLCEIKQYSFAKEKLAGSIVTVCQSMDIHFDTINDLDINHDNFKILRVYNSNWVAIFDMNKVVKNGYLTLQAPKHIAGFIIGRNGSNIQSWAREIEVKKIQVIPI